MECPKCGSPFESVIYAAIEVDRCTNCHGLWFDAMEREDLKNLRGSETIDVGDPGVGRQYNDVDRIECPRCHTRMVRMVDPKQSHIWFESCPVCYGAFFDAGEFKDYKEETLMDFVRSVLTPERR
jgi:Zn-finger nucleic acid-binding protein